MSTVTPGRTGLILHFAIIAVAACSSASQSAPPIIRPGAPGEASSAAAATDRSPRKIPHVPADTRFMQGMIVHHGQALEMTSLVPARSSNEDIRRLAQRIEASQKDEIARIRHWLEARGEPADAMQGHEAHAAHAMMPGMLSAEEMATLDKSSGAAFDRLFLEDMIRHHEGALVMVAELNAAPGAGQEPEIFRFATDVDADQRAEIARMRRMLATLQ